MIFNLLQQFKTNIINSIKTSKKFIIIPYTQTSYIICNNLIYLGYLKKQTKFYSKVTNIYYILIEFFIILNINKIKSIMINNPKLKQNHKTYKQLQFLNYSKGFYNYILTTTSGIITLDKALLLKQGGQLLLSIL